MAVANGSYVKVDGFGGSIGRPLHQFLVDEALPAAGIEPGRFFAILDELVTRFAPRNRELLDIRDRMQSQIDNWHRERSGELHQQDQYRSFLEEIGYLIPPGEPFLIDVKNIDPEISSIPGPQLVVPITNARYAINAANARWGSLYDAVYGTDVVANPPAPGPYDPARGDQVISYGRCFLDDVVPLSSGSHVGSKRYSIVDSSLEVELADGTITGLKNPSQFVAFDGPALTPDAILLSNNGLGIDLRFDPFHGVGKADSAGLSNIILESAITAIMDCEDSVSAVDAADKAAGYRNWLGLVMGTLRADVSKDGTSFVRTLAQDRFYRSPGGEPVRLAGRALMLVRNVGHLMTTPAVLDASGNEIPEGLLDALVTTLCASATGATNSRTGSIYVVKPKMHGPDEVAFAVETFEFIENELGLDRDTVKLGIMDEERRTSVNLQECIRAASTRVAFINTGFLDRTGDEIHTSMEAGPMVPKSEMKEQRWISAYEDHNVDVGLACGFAGRAQIGKGMWAAPDRMGAMVAEKVDHPRAGASCAWVPSPTAATLHAMHYHQVDVLAVQASLSNRERASLDDILTIPLAASIDWSRQQVQEELDNNAQGILGYVVRWVEAGVGCSKVPDINDVGLMEDRATCRISSQHISNWLHHGIVTARQVTETFERMAAKVDAQNALEPSYQPMAPSFDGHGYLAALELVLSGIEQPSGYTEPILHSHRLQLKAAQLGAAIRD